MTYKFLFFVFFLFNWLSITAQGQPLVKASVSKNQILIGEPFVLTIEASFAPNTAYSFFDIDTIPHFEFLDKPIIDTINKNGNVSIKGVYKLTSFDSGRWEIPSFSFSKSDDGIKTELIPIDVVFAPFNANQEYHDIKDVESIPKPAKPFKWWYVIVGALSGALVFYLLKRRKQPLHKSIVAVNAYQQAMEHLQQLRNSRPATKEYYAGITGVFREYILHKKGIKSLQKTTGDLLVQLQKLGLSNEQYNKLHQTLSLCDFVKFAKFIPTKEDDEMVYTDIISSIKVIELTDAKTNTRLHQ